MFQVIALMLLSQQPFQPVAEGYASFYTVNSNRGCVTASGENFRDGMKTCAMRGGVFGDFYLVVAENGNSVVCKLTDRGPFVKGRVIDLSRAAMKELDDDAGLLRVRVYHLGSHPSRAPSNN